MREPPDQLLFALSTWRNVPYSRFRQAADVLFVSEGNADRRTIVRSGLRRGLDSLGHLDTVAADDGLVLVVNEPTLARLPATGLPSAVLCGARSPDAVSELIEAGRQVDARVVWRSQASADPPAPSLVCAEADSEESLAALAASLGIGLALEPPAWALLEVCPNVRDFGTRLQWERAMNLNWERMDFDPGRPGFGRSRPAADHLGLSRYRDPVRGTFRYVISRANEMAVVRDPDWARWLVLSEADNGAITYDRNKGALATPAAVPLPALIARSLVLCSGSVPSRIVDSRGRHQLLYQKVPPSIAVAAAHRLGQSLIPPANPQQGAASR